jgi:hypothetical protein
VRVVFVEAPLWLDGMHEADGDRDASWLLPPPSRVVDS